METPDEGQLTSSSFPQPTDGLTTAARGAPKNAATQRYIKAQARKGKVLDLIRAGMTLAQALGEAKVTVAAYEKWRQRDDDFKHRVDAVRVELREDRQGRSTDDIDHAEFAMRYFGHKYAWFQLAALEAVENTDKGGITLVQFPPDHGKTSLYENMKSEDLARNPDMRNVIVSENLTIARKILARIKNRMEPTGPAPGYVARFGPFIPQVGEGRQSAQPWGADYFNVYGKATHDERDYSLLALGAGSSIVSARTDHLHLDDIQSLKTLNFTTKLHDWFRQDALTRVGERGITTIFGTKVGDDDFMERLEDDDDLDGILKVVRLPAIVENKITGLTEPLWPERFTLDELDRIRRKVGQAVWDRAYMMHRGSESALRTFTDDAIDRCKDSEVSLEHPPTEGSVVFVALDPALGGKNCVVAVEVTPTGKLILRAVREKQNLQSNEQIMEELETVIASMTASGARVTDVVIETMNFQKGLANDERLQELRYEYGFSLRPHLTGWNKYDDDIGVASMAMSFNRGDIVLPWAPDNVTRTKVEELIRQLKAWRPFIRGTRLRQDQVMALWFAWILWQSRHKRAPDETEKRDGWRVQGVPWQTMSSGLILPVGARP